MSCREFKIVAIIGTRPEAVKMAPVIALMKESSVLSPIVISTGQHREMLQTISGPFGIHPDEDLAIMQPEQSLNQIASQIIAKLEIVLERMKPDLVLVQGDTSSTFAAALVAFHSRIPVAHIEAGLRTHNRQEPFPEEANRRLISTLSDIHFAPTKLAKINLVNEGINKNRIYVTGNTVTDAQQTLEGRASESIKQFVRRVKQGNGKLILVTSHRRESWGKPLENICNAIMNLATSLPDVSYIFPLHKNPKVRNVVNSTLGSQPKVYLKPHLPYPDLLYVLKHSDLVMTDSGGIQEEAPSYNVPVLILRNETERPEIIWEQIGVLAGTDKKKIVQEAIKMLGRKKDSEPRCTPNPFGDGKAASRIILALERYSQGHTPLLSAEEQFPSKTLRYPVQDKQTC